MKLGGSGGGALPLVLGLSTLLAMLGALSLLAAEADLLLAARLARGRSAFYAAESGLAVALDQLRREVPGAVPETSFHPPWETTAIPDRRWRDGEWSVARRVAPVPDATDADADPGTALVLFNRSFGYDGSPLPRGGYPVFAVTVEAVSGEAAHAVVAEVAPVTLAPRLDAAWTAAGPLRIEGDVLVSGAAHAADGGDDPEGVPVPAARSPGTVELAAGARAEAPAGAGRAVDVDPALAPPESALAALNAGTSLPDLGLLPPPPADGAISGAAWSRGDLTGPADGEGLLVVHNPLFDPVRHEASRVALEEGTITGDWDPDYSHLDPARAPARLCTPLGGEFRGVVVADAVGHCGAPLTVIGALLTLSRSPERATASAPLRVLWSPATAERPGRGPLGHVTAFRALPGGMPAR